MDEVSCEAASVEETPSAVDFFEEFVFGFRAGCGILDAERNRYAERMLQHALHV